MTQSRPRIQITFSDVQESAALAPEMSFRGPWWMWALFLALIAIVSIAPAMFGRFLPLDDLNVTENVFLRSWGNLRAIWRLPYADMFPQFSPLGYTVYMLEYRIWGGVATHAASGYRLVSLGLHILNVLLLWTMLRKIAVRSAFVAAAVFAAHPVQVQTVAWISQQPQLLGASLALMSLIVYLRYCGINPAPFMPARLRLPETGALLYAIALILFLLAMLAKPAMGALPLVILCIIWWESGRIGMHEIKPLVPFLAITLLSAIAAGLVYFHSADIRNQHLSLVERIAVIGPALWCYVYELIRPGTFSFMYPRWQANSWWAWLMLAAAGGTIAFLYRERNRLGRGACAAAMGFVILLLPSVLFLDLRQTRDSFVSDSAMYLPLAAAIAAAVGGITNKLFSRGQEVTPRSAGAWFAIVAMALCTALSFYLARSYTGPEALWSAALARNPDSVYGLNQLGMLELNWNQSNAAADKFRRALAIDPSNSQTHRNLGAYFENIGQWDRAYAEYLVVLSARPQDIEARCGLARSLAAQGNRSAALKQYQIVLNYKPEDERALNDMAAVYIDLGQYEKAIDCYERALRAAPRYIATHVNLANLYYRVGRYNDAAAELDNAAAIDPMNYVIYVNLGAMRGQLADRVTDPTQKKQLIQGAEIAFRQALYCNPDSAVAAYNLANVLAYESRMSAADPGKMKEAVFYFAKACQLDPENREYKLRLSEARKSRGSSGDGVR